MNTKQKLGIRVFYYYLSKKISLGIVLLILSVIISFSSKNFLISKISFVLSLKTATIVISYFVNGLIIISILFIIIALATSWLTYISCYFVLGDNAISITKGILNKKEISIPYRQIQNINIEQTFSHKMMGVSRLIILTAGNDSNDKEGEAEGVFDVIDTALAERTRESILQKTSIQNNSQI